ncbi:MAG TPA: prenyltransferase/squalene oxidase repeat-containing protein [Bryobacteraceae bacterium]|nr:prenyltransferase/squalene oxidase repeat-containing protein [Bryobacteraceae bacterium]
MPIENLLERQNPDGGWPYSHGGSWTEPTVYAILASLAAGERDAADRGMRWIVSARRPDGGWAPCGGVDQSTWVTGLVALLPPERLGRPYYEEAVRWLLRTTGEESAFSYRLREFLLGNSPPPEQKFPGWPWVPGAAAWVGPTSIAILALRQAARRGASPPLQKRLEAGRGFLLAHMCRDGGWNHGSVRPLGYESNPYPETTGMALAALAGTKSPEVDRALTVARQFLAECRSADALNWLRLGLMAHGQLPADYCAPTVTYRTTPETALGLLVAQKDNPLLGAIPAGERG